jgi:hypothetical protein
MAQSEIPRVALCVLRVESRGTPGLLITVTTSSDMRVTTPGRTTSVAEPEEALVLVAEFLREYQENTAR